MTNITKIFNEILRRNPTEFEYKKFERYSDYKLRKHLRGSVEFVSKHKNIRLSKSTSNDKLNTSVIEDIPIMINTDNKLVLTITYNSYPLGGGESFLYHCCKLFAQNGYKNVWISFSDGIISYEKDIITSDNICTFHKTKYSIGKVKYLINHYKPSIIHTQGRIVKNIKDVLINTNIQTIIGYHYWDGIVNLGETHNKDIIHNIRNHKLDESYIEFRKPHIKLYVCSEFLNDVINMLKGPVIKNILYPISDESEYRVYYNTNNEYISQINVHPLKGGKLFYEVAKALPHIKFLAICNEMCETNLYSDMKKLNNVEVVGYTDIREIYDKTRIILQPNKVDETFSRVAFESASNGIPIITTGKGYVKQMLGDDAIYLDYNVKDWVDKILELYNDKDKLLEISSRLKNRIEHYKKSKTIIDLIQQTKVEDIKTGINTLNVMILCPWSDIGLGIQSKFYSKILRSNNIKTKIFSFKPYMLTFKNTNRFQKDPNEWHEYDSIYYSDNLREEIRDGEILKFIKDEQIDICIIPEICYSRIFQIANLLKKNNVKVYAVPNVECVRRDELKKFNVFDKILSPSLVCIDHLKDYNNNIFYIGHGLSQNCNKMLQSGRINLLHIGGYNFHTRKNTVKIIEEFLKAVNYNKILYLTVTISVSDDIISSYKHDNLTIINKILSHEEIMDLYLKSHISIQCSSHEGLGLGFYESISHSTPVITFNYPPHNEVIKENKNGWYVDHENFILEDNNEALVLGCKIKNNSLSNLLINLKEKDVQEMIDSTIKTFKDYDLDTFIQRFIQHFKK